MLMRDVLAVGRDPDERRDDQLRVMRRLWQLLFKQENAAAYA
jgi:hypothetical protein